MTPSASSWRSRCTIGLMPSVRASDGSAPGPEPNIARPFVMWSSWTMRCATLNGWWYGSETTPVPSMMRCGALAGGRQEHLRRGDHLPAGRVVLAAPELVEAEAVEVRGEVEVALELEHRVLAERVVRREERAELQSAHVALHVPCGRTAPSRRGVRVYRPQRAIVHRSTLRAICGFRRRRTMEASVLHRRRPIVNFAQ